MTPPPAAGNAARERFCELIARPDDEIPLAEVALWIAAEGRPDLDVRHYLAELEAIAERIRPSVEAAEGDVERVARLNRALFQQEGFRGNRDAYQDPLNSYLDAVIDRRTGIPITLALVYVEVACRLGLDAVGVGFPGHFLAKVRTREGDVIVDAFHGRCLSEAECATLLRELVPDARFEPELLAASPRARIVQRILGNLKQIWVASRDFERALACCERITLVAPDDPIELRDRGLIYQYLECHASALADLKRFLELAPGDPSAEQVRAIVNDLEQLAGHLH